MKKLDEADITVILSVALIFGICLIGLGAGWYHACLQSDLYRREGIDVTPWECFVGVKPAERVIQVKDIKKAEEKPHD